MKSPVRSASEMNFDGKADIIQVKNMAEEVMQ